MRRDLPGKGAATMLRHLHFTVNWLRSVAAATLFATVWLMYAMAQGTMADHIGFDWRYAGLTAMFTGVFTLLLVLPCAMLVCLMSDALTARRFSEGHCPHCLHQRDPESLHRIDTQRCPECGGIPRLTTKNRLIRHSRLAAAAIIFSLACAAADGWLRLDEFVFTAQATAPTTPVRSGPYVRPRWWPNTTVSLRWRGTQIVND